MAANDFHLQHLPFVANSFRKRHSAKLQMSMFSVHRIAYMDGVRVHTPQFRMSSFLWNFSFAIPPTCVCVCLFGVLGFSTSFVSVAAERQAHKMHTK